MIFKQSDLSEQDYIFIANHLKSSGIIVYPTETSYGIGANALDDKAVSKIYRLKSRDPGKPLPVLVRDIKMLVDIAVVERNEEEIISKFWPGPLTILFKSKISRGGRIFMSGSGLIGARISPHPFPAAVLSKINFPITATSANISGENSLSGFKGIPDIFPSTDDSGKEILFIDGGELPGGSSTVIRAGKRKVDVLREGSNNLRDKFLCYIKNKLINGGWPYGKNG